MHVYDIVQPKLLLMFWMRPFDTAQSQHHVCTLYYPQVLTKDVFLLE